MLPLSFLKVNQLERVNWEMRYGVKIYAITFCLNEKTLNLNIEAQPTKEIRTLLGNAQPQIRICLCGQLRTLFWQTTPDSR